MDLEKFSNYKNPSSNPSGTVDFNVHEDRLLEKGMAVGDLAQADQDDFFENVKKQAQKLFQKKLFTQAEALLRSFHARGLGTDETYCLLGMIYYQQNQFKKALLCYKKALEKNPSHLESLVHFSLLRLDLGDYERGFFLYKKAMECLSLKKQDKWKQYISERHLQSGDAYFKRGFYHEALLEFLKAYPNEKYPLLVDIKIVRCLWNLDRKSEAFKKLLQLRKLHPVSIPVGLLLGEFYFHMRKIPLAVNEWERVLRFDPENKTAVKWLYKTQDIQSVREDVLD